MERGRIRREPVFRIVGVGIYQVFGIVLFWVGCYGRLGLPQLTNLYTGLSTKIGQEDRKLLNLCIYVRASGPAQARRSVKLVRENQSFRVWVLGGNDIQAHRN